ncbi:MAG: cytosolic protein [Chloroflexi bacterium]|nr:cytosolic protein [Chloroflexota bacterium]
MNPIKIDDVKAYVQENIGGFHSSRLQSLRGLRLSQILRRKNPYLFKAKNVLLAQDLVKMLLDAHLSSQEEALFGNFLEGLAVFINRRVYGGWKSSTEGIDLEFDKGGTRYIVAIKSGPNWGNSSQIRKMKDDFNKAKRALRTGNSEIRIVAANGCCYGRDNNPDKGDYYKYCGQKFWEFISGNKDLYLKIIKPLGYTARKRNAEFFNEYAQIVNRFTVEFSKNFVTDGKIDWDALVKFNSSSSKTTIK